MTIINTTMNCKSGNVRKIYLNYNNDGKIAYRPQNVCIFTNGAPTAEKKGKKREQADYDQDNWNCYRFISCNVDKCFIFILPPRSEND